MMKPYDEPEQFCENCEHYVCIKRGDGLLIRDWHCEMEVPDDVECTKYEPVEYWPEAPEER